MYTAVKTYLDRMKFCAVPRNNENNRLMYHFVIHQPENFMEQIGLEQAYDLTVLGNIDRLCRGDLGEPRHGHDITCQNDDESRTCGNADVLDGDGKAVGSTELGRVIGE